jgi:hypothetical protein
MLMDTSGKRGHSNYQPPRRGNLSGGRMMMSSSGKRGYNFYQPPQRGHFGNISQRFNPYNPADKPNPIKIEVANENDDQSVSVDVNNTNNIINNDEKPKEVTQTKSAKSHLLFDSSSSEGEEPQE